MNGFCNKVENQNMPHLVIPIISFQFPFLAMIQSIHGGPVLEMAVDSTSTLLATGSSDMSIKVWDVDRKYWTHNLKGHKGVIT